MLGSKGILTPLIPNCYVLCTLAILKTFVIRSFFFKKWLLTHVFGGSQVQKSSCKQACIGFMTFWPWYHVKKNIKKSPLCLHRTGHRIFRGVWNYLGGPDGFLRPVWVWKSFFISSNTWNKGLLPFRITYLYYRRNLWLKYVPFIKKI